MSEEPNKDDLTAEIPPVDHGTNFDQETLKQLKELAFAITDKHEQENHDGEPCITERVNLVAYIAHCVGLDQSLDSLADLLSRIAQYRFWHDKPDPMLRKIQQKGIDRVVVSADGEAVGPKEAYEQRGVSPTIIFVRDDGWTLGAPHSLVDVAEKTWPDRWTHVIAGPNPKPMPYDEWKRATAPKQAAPVIAHEVSGNLLIVDMPIGIPANRMFETLGAYTSQLMGFGVAVPRMLLEDLIADFGSPPDVSNFVKAVLALQLDPEPQFYMFREARKISDKQTVGL